MPLFKARRSEGDLAETRATVAKAGRPDDEMDTAARVLALAQETADRAVADAKREAEQIIAQARQEAQQIITDARSRGQDS
jgi:F0F1-type ATP synthase membrane subunit b/b'